MFQDRGVYRNQRIWSCYTRRTSLLNLYNRRPLHLDRLSGWWRRYHTSSTLHCSNYASSDNCTNCKACSLEEARAGHLGGQGGKSTCPRRSQTRSVIGASLQPCFESLQNLLPFKISDSGNLPDMIERTQHDKQPVSGAETNLQV